jgi:hypothetical protein
MVSQLTHKIMSKCVLDAVGPPVHFVPDEKMCKNQHDNYVQNMCLLPGDILPQQLVESTIASEYQGPIHRLDDPLSQAVQIRSNAHGSASDVGQGENVLRWASHRLSNQWAKMRIHWDTADTLYIIVLRHGN